ncbi:hypothetical protein WJX73_004370 [Symbiochloris irregularis]|uniref:Mediator complex subunit 15 KIX domain-containing protein n=1 Tax=Symbiochloris irregularis TaxID=706552 RepID=A0AAW1PZY1_9CHLO
MPAFDLTPEQRRSAFQQITQNLSARSNQTPQELEGVVTAFEESCYQTAASAKDYYSQLARKLLRLQKMTAANGAGADAESSPADITN